MERNSQPGVERPERRPNWTTIALIGGFVVLVFLVAYFAASRNPDQDKLTANEIAQTEPPAAAEKFCSSKATYEMIKRELFRRAAQLRGSDQAAYDKLAAYAFVRMENPVMESEDSASGAVNCSGSLSLDLPPGVAAEGGRRTLMSDVDYGVDASGAVSLRNADAIVAPLAKLFRVGEPQPAAPADGNEVAPNDMNMVAPAEPVAAPPIGPTRPVSARPSFDCDDAHSRGEIMVCSDAGLAALDRNMAAQYSRALSAASPAQRDQLQGTARRFQAFRDRCPTNACIGDAYVGRIREIRDIIEGRWRAAQ